MLQYPQYPRYTIVDAKNKAYKIYNYKKIRTTITMIINIIICENFFTIYIKRYNYVHLIFNKASVMSAYKDFIVSLLFRKQRNYFQEKLTEHSFQRERTIELVNEEIILEVRIFFLLHIYFDHSAKIIKNIILDF